MKVLFASTPATGHLNPMLAIANILIADGHEIAFLIGSVFRARVEASGAKFFALPKGTDFDLRDIHSVAPELKTTAPGLEWLRVACERILSMPSRRRTRAFASRWSTSRPKSSSVMT